MTPTQEHIEGFVAPIHRGVWEPVLAMGAPRVWTTVWLVLCLWVSLLFLTVLGLRWVLLPPIAWALGQGGLVLLTQWDPFWVDVGVAHLCKHGRRWGYQSFYAAG
jgi:type IV secretion system protein VirB3